MFCKTLRVKTGIGSVSDTYNRYPILLSSIGYWLQVLVLCILSCNDEITKGAVILVKKLTLRSCSRSFLTETVTSEQSVLSQNDLFRINAVI